MYRYRPRIEKQVADRFQCVFWKQYSFSKGLIIPRDSLITIDPLNVIKNYDFKYAAIYVKYLLEWNQFEGMQYVIQLLKNQGIQKIFVYYHPETDNPPSEQYIDKRLGKIKHYSVEEYKKEIKRCDEIKSQMDSLREIDNVKFITKKFHQYHRREICFFKADKYDPDLSILCDRDFSDLGDLEGVGIKGVTYTYIKFRKGGDSNHAKELKASGWKDGTYKQINNCQRSYPVHKVLENKDEDKIVSVGDTMDIQVVHFREKTHVDELQEILKIQKPNYNHLKNINIKTIQRKCLYLWDKQKELTEEQKEKLKELEVLDSKCLEEFMQTNKDKNINIDSSSNRHDFHVNFITLPNAKPFPIRILCDEGFQYHMKEDAHLPTTARKTRPFLVVTLHDYEKEVKYCLEHRYFESGKNITDIETTRSNLLAAPGKTIGCPSCKLALLEF